MKLEILPNEIILDLFVYFNGIDLLRTFYGLNSRFNLLLYNQFRSYCFQFNSVSKRSFDIICQQHLPSIADRVIVLQLSDDNETPGQINLFCSYIPSIRQFTHLRSLSLSNLHSYKILLKLLDECQQLCNLIQLKLSSCSFSNCSADSQLIVDNIWSLPKLTSCHVDIDIKEQQVFRVPTIISSSLECVTIFHSDVQWNQINRLFEYTPRLKYLSIFIGSILQDDYIVSALPTLTQCSLYFYDESIASRANIFFQSTPNLCHLSIDTWSELIDGHQWEQIIRNYLPKLKIFRLKMEKILLFEQNIQEQANRLIDSFRSSFWIIEHEWFVRCFTRTRTTYLYTLSGAPNYYEDIFPDTWRSTCPHDNQQEFYSSMNSIFNETFFDQPISSDIRLSNINHLSIKLPINDKFWSIVPNFNQLKTLSISSYANTFQSQLQNLLDRAPHLYRLRINQDTSLPLQMFLFKYTNASVRRLNLEDFNHCFNEEECMTLTRSPLAVQCEVLLISVKNRESIIHLVKNMLNLRALIVKCIDNKYLRRSAFTENNDEMIRWLKNQLPSTYLFVRDPEADNNVLIWM